MSTTTQPTPVGPFAAPSQARPDDSLDAAQATESLEPTSGELIIDSLELLDHRNRERAIAPRLALRGHYLAFGGGQKTRLLAIDRDVTHIGRAGSAEIRLEHQRVSRDHAILVRHGRHFRLLDNRSSNGTFVNGRQIVATNIQDGDVIEVGPVLVRFVEVP
jgi:pSer/pThr/pTyr-binding forkhead associated (FHA) protein